MTTLENIRGLIFFSNECKLLTNKLINTWTWYRFINAKQKKKKREREKKKKGVGEQKLKPLHWA